MAAGVQLDAMLVRTPDVCGGRLRIDGTRVSVLQIATQYRRGETPEEIAHSHPQRRSQRHAAYGDTTSAADNSSTTSPL
jgi:uncharacterized protein (DUF433 family)